MGELTETLKQLRYARYDEERQVIYRYITYRLQWHIAAKIGRKFKNCEGGRPASDRKPQDRLSDAEVIEIENERKVIGEQICKVHDWLEEGIRFNEEAKDLNDNPLAITRALNALDIFNQLPEYITQGNRMDTAREMINFALSTALDQWKTDQIETINMMLEEKKKNKKMAIERQRQLEYSFDQRRTVRKLTGNVTPMNDLDPEINEAYWAGRWSKEVEFNPIQMDAFYKLDKVWTDEEGETMVDQLLDEKKMLRLIRHKGNLSAPGYDALTFPILKLEADASTKMMVELMRS
jgi:hypothetical protein